MKSITRFVDIDKQQWLQLLETSPVLSWFQSPEAFEFYASLPEMYTPFCYAIVREDSDDVLSDTYNYYLKGIVVGYLTKENSWIKQFFARRAIIYGGPLLAEDISNDELQQLLNGVTACCGGNPIYIETRNFNDYSRWRSDFEKCGFQYEQHYDIHIDTDTENNMWQRLHDSKKRQLTKDKNKDIHCIVAENTEQVYEFYILLKDLYKKKVHKPLPKFPFFKTFFERNCGKYLLTIQDGKLVGGMMCPMLKGRILYEWYVVGDTFTTWSAMCYAAEHGYELLDLMGAGEPNVPYGVRDFKMQMGGKLHEFGRFMCIKNKFLYQLGKQIIQLRQKI